MADSLGVEQLPENLKILARSRSKYNDIFVIQNNRVREMWFKGDEKYFLQSKVDLADPLAPVLVYSRMMMATLLFNEAPNRVLIIGLGGASVSNCLHGWYPQCHIDVVEVDGNVVHIAKKYFLLVENKNYIIHEGDGRKFVKECQGGEKYDLVIIDAFKSGSVPFHLKTQEFYQEIKNIIAADGVIASNLYGKSNKLKPRDLKTFSSIFKQIYLFEDPDRVATVLVGADREEHLGPEQIRSAAENFIPPERMTLPMREVAEMQMQNPFSADGKQVFEDDFQGNDFKQAVEENNLTNSGKNRPYPISNIS